MPHLSRGLIAASLLGAVPAIGAAQQPNEVHRLRWMAGCWEMRTPTRVMHEWWMAPLGGMMLGMSRTVVRGAVREYEALRVELRDGVPTYVAQPAGQPVTLFGASTTSDTLVVFSNPAHDFPQRIIYRRVGADSLIARIEGDQGGRLQGIDYPMARAACGE